MSHKTYIMFSFFLFIVSILIGILALVFLILGLINNKKQYIIGGGVGLAFSAILFFFTLFSVIESYFNFVGNVMEESYQREQCRENIEEDFVLLDSDFADTLYDANDSIFILHGLEEVQTSKGPKTLAFYKPASFGLCILKEVSLKNDKQVNIVLSQSCSETYPNFLEVFNEKNTLINSSSFVQIQPTENGDNEIQYILRKELDRDNAYYIILKYD